MAGVLALLAVPIALGVALGSWALFRLFAALRRGGGLAGRPRASWRSASRSTPRRRSTRGASRPRSREGAVAADRRRGHRPQGDRRRLRRRGLAGDPADDGEGRAPHLRRHRPRRGDRPAGVDPRLQLGRHLGLDLHRDDSRAARRPRLLPDRAARAWRRRGSTRSTAPTSRSSSDLVAPLGLATPDPGRPLLAGGPAATGRSPTGRGSRPASWTATSTPSRRCAPSRPESWFLSYGLDEMAARPSPQVALFAAAGVALPGDPAAARRRRLQLAVGGPPEAARRAPAPRLVNFYTHQPDSDQHWFWKWYEPERFFNVKAKDLAEEGRHHPRGLPRLRRLPRPPPRRGRAGHRRRSSPPTMATARRSSTASIPSTGTAPRASC